MLSTTRNYGPALVAGLTIAMLAGCMVGPDYQPPRAQIPADWTGPTMRSESPSSALPVKGLASWWTVFQDPILTTLVERAIGSNLDLKQAEARIRQARAARGIASSGMGPTVDANGSYDHSRSPAGSQSRSNDSAVTYDQYQAGFDAGWELDLFGGVRRGIEAADADLQAAVEAHRDVLVTLTAEVARDYVDLRALQQRIIIAERNLESQRHTADLTRQRFQAGFASGLDVANAQALAASTAAQIPVLQALAQQTIHSLGVLLGLAPAALLEELSPAGSIPIAPPSVPAGVPSDLLRRRPDIREAEARIHGATARIGVATADLFPSFTISGTAGFQGTDLGSTLSWAGRFWSFGPSASWHVFDTGRTRSNIELQKALEEESVLSYRQTVLAALQEVEDTLIASAKEQDRRTALAESVKANRRAVELATELYTEGQVDFLNVLDAQRSLYSSEDTWVQSSQTVSTDLVALYKALGGGWSE